MVPALLLVALLGLSACTKWDEQYVNKFQAGSDPTYMDELRALLRQQGVPYMDDREGGIAFRPVDRPKFDQALRQLDRHSAWRFEDAALAQLLVEALDGMGRDYKVINKAGKTYVVWRPQTDEELREAQARYQKIFADRTSKTPVYQREEHR